MTTTLETTLRIPTPAQLLKQQTIAVRLSFHWLCVRAKMEDAQAGAMAAVVEADPDSVGVSKKLYNLKLPSLKEIGSLKGQIKQFVEHRTVPYVDAGVRLLRREGVAEFDERMGELQTILAQAAQKVQEERDAILADARQRLKKAFNEANYPHDFTTLFGMEWSFPSIEPPNYLAQLAPEIYEQEKQRAAARFDEALALAEQAFLAEFKAIVDTLYNALAPNPDGTKKIIRHSCVGNLLEFFDRFKALSVGGNVELEMLISQAKELTAGIDAADLRGSKVLKSEITQGLTDIRDKVAPLVMNKPRRSIIRLPVNND